jgi:hypothetical protein
MFITILTTVQSITRPVQDFITWFSRGVVSPLPKTKDRASPPATEKSVYSQLPSIPEISLWAYYNTAQGTHTTRHVTSHIKILRITRVNPRPVNVGSVVDKEALGQVLLRLLQFSPASMIPSTLHPLSHKLYNLSNWQHNYVTYKLLKICQNTQNS